MIDDYTLGILYGDGYFQKRDYNDEDYYLFTTTHKEIADKIKSFLISMDYRYSYRNRSFGEGHYKENYEILEIVEIYDEKFLEILIENGFKSDEPSERISFNKGFMRGYLETKGTIFEYESRGNKAWRIAISGNEGDVRYIAEKMESILNINITKVTQRKEREHLGIISNSFRVNIQNRIGIAKFVEFIDGNEYSRYLHERVEGFKHFHKTSPFNRNRVFKNYKYAVGSMARELKITIKGVRGISAKRWQKPVFLWEDDEIVLCFNNWEKSYMWISEKYEKETGIEPPIVEWDKDVEEVNKI